MRFQVNKAIPHHEYEIKTEMRERHRVQSVCRMQAESSLLTCHLCLIPHVWTKGFLSMSNIFYSEFTCPAEFMR